MLPSLPFQMVVLAHLRRFNAVFVVQTLPNYAQPWQMRPQRSSAGSAFILDTERKEIMTNAHVVHFTLRKSSRLRLGHYMQDSNLAAHCKLRSLKSHLLSARLAESCNFNAMRETDANHEQ